MADRCGRLVAGQSQWVQARIVAYRLYACPVCGTKAPLQQQYVAYGTV